MSERIETVVWTRKGSPPGSPRTASFSRGEYPLALTGGYAVQAHGLVDRLSQDLDVATENPERMDNIATAVRIGLEQRGWQVSALETDPLSARLIVTDPVSREECEVDILKEALRRPPVHTEHGLVLSLEDVVGTKVRAWPIADSPGT